MVIAIEFTITVPKKSPIIVFLKQKIMRKIFFLPLLAFLIMSCGTDKSGFTVKLDIPDQTGSWLKINKLVDSEFTVVDSVLVDSLGKNELTGSVAQAELMYLTIEGERRPIRLIIENSDYTVSGTWQEPTIESSSSIQKDLQVYEEGLDVYNEQMSSLYQEYRIANAEGDEAKVDSLVNILEDIDAKINAYDSLYISNSGKSIISVIALRNIFYKYDAEGLEIMLGKIDENAHYMEEYKYMATKLEQMQKVAVGQPYTDFGLETPEGAILNVSDVHNNTVLLIDFWASWCGPCRAANPELVALYNEYHEEGFDILGVSLDRERDSWLKGIETDGLVWSQISDLQFWNCAGAQLYGVSSIPHAVLLDRKGIIRARNLSGDELKAKVTELLAE